MRVIAVLKTHLGAGWHDPSGGGRGRQTSDIYRAGEQRSVRPTVAEDRDCKVPPNTLKHIILTEDTNLHETIWEEIFM